MRVRRLNLLGLVWKRSDDLDTICTTVAHAEAGIIEIILIIIIIGIDTIVGLVWSHSIGHLSFDVGFVEDTIP